MSAVTKKQGQTEGREQVKWVDLRLASCKKGKWRSEKGILDIKGSEASQFLWCEIQGVTLRVSCQGGREDKMIGIEK